MVVPAYSLGGVTSLTGGSGLMTGDTPAYDSTLIVGAALTPRSGFMEGTVEAASELPQREQKTAPLLFLYPHDGHCSSNARGDVLLRLRDLVRAIAATTMTATDTISIVEYVAISDGIPPGRVHWTATLPPTGMFVSYRTATLEATFAVRKLVCMSTPVILSYHERC